MWCKGALLGVALVVAVAIVVGWTTMRNLGRFLDVSEDVASADAIVVMGGEGGRFSRTQHAIDLYKAGVSPARCLQRGDVDWVWAGMLLNGAVHRCGGETWVAGKCARDLRRGAEHLRRS